MLYGCARKGNAKATATLPLAVDTPDEVIAPRNAGHSQEYAIVPLIDGCTI